jgi:hypothetical protein
LPASTQNATHQHIADPAASSIHYPSTHRKSLTLTALTQAHEKRLTFYPAFTRLVKCNIAPALKKHLPGARCPVVSLRSTTG